MCIKINAIIIKFDMIKNYLSYFKIIVLMLCSVVGVGFVSGAEIYQFFVRFGKFSNLGVLVFFILIFCLANKILNENQEAENIVKMNNSSKLSLKNTFLTKLKLKSKLKFFNILMMSSAMFAGLFNIINKLFFNNYFIFCILAIVIIFVILFFGISGLQKFDYLVLCLIAFIALYFCFNDCVYSGGFVETYYYKNNLKDLISSVIFSGVYVFMNIVQIQPILMENKIEISTKSRRLISLIFACVLTILLFVFVKFFHNNLYLKHSEMPFLKYFKEVGGFLYIFFIMGLFMALFSSLITSLIGVKNVLIQKIKSNLFSTILTIVLSCFFSLIGFSNFVLIVYPMIGIINFIIYVFL